MFSGKTSRSHSLSSQKSGEFRDAAYEPYESTSQGTEIINNESYQFTKNHPQGAAFLKIVEDLTNLAKKSNVKSMSTNVDEFCTSFHNSVRLERDRTSDLIGNSNHEIEMNIINKELNSHKINASIEPPTYFSPIKVATSIQRTADINKVFPKPGRFSGNNKDGSMGVVEFLRSLVAAQSQCGLSEPEFLDRLLDSSTGQAHDLILEWKSNGMDTASIFHNLLLNYDRRLSAEQARNQLIGYKVPRSADLATAEAHIVKLIGRAATALPTGESRNTYYNLEGCNALIRALPPYSSQLANTTYNHLTAKFGRACTLLELSKGLNLHRSNVDKDIAEHGATQIKGPRFVKPNYKGTKFSAYAINNIVDRSPQKTYSPPYERSFTPRPQQMVKQRPGLFSANKQTYRKPGPMKNIRDSRRNNFRRANNAQDPSEKCKMCGQRSHNSKDCQNIRDDQGKIIKMIATYATCSKCPNFIKPRLHHPEPLCPFRIGGPLNRKSRNHN